jgi:hypothetical protein
VRDFELGQIHMIRYESDFNEALRILRL